MKSLVFQPMLNVSQLAVAVVYTERRFGKQITWTSVVPIEVTWH